MASPAPLSKRMRGKRASRAVSYHEEEDDDHEQESEQEEEERPLRRNRRPGKEPAEDDYEEEGEEDEEEQPRPKRGRKAEPAAAGGSQRRGRPPKIKPDPEARRPALLQELGAPAGGTGLEGGPVEVPGRELRALDELMAEYKRQADNTRAKFKGSVSRQELDSLVRRVMRHMLFLHSEKPGVPVSRAELTKLISGNAAQKKHNMTGVVISLAQYKMLEVFGLEMSEITKAPQRGVNKAAAAAVGEGTKHLVLRSAVPPTLMAECVQDRREDPLRGFAAVLVSLIELEGGKIQAHQLWPLLEELGVREQGVHPRFGRPAELLEHLTRRRYINMERQQGPDGEVRTYTVAENALDELGRENIQAFYEAEFARECGGEA